MFMCYAFTPDSKFHQMAQTTRQTSMLYLGIVPLIYVNETICWYSALLQDSSQSFYGQGWIIWCQNYQKMQLMDEGPGAILNFKTFLSFH